MIQATKALLEKLRDVKQYEADNLPERSFFGDKNDLEGSREAAKFIQWIIDNFDDKNALRLKRLDVRTQLAKQFSPIEDERWFLYEEILDWVDGKNDTVYLDHGCDDE